MHPLVPYTNQLQYIKLYCCKVLNLETSLLSVPYKNSSKSITASQYDCVQIYLAKIFL